MLDEVDGLRREDCAYVFPGEHGDRPYGGFPKAIKRIMELRPELHGLTAHVLRHSFASVADELGYTEATVAAMLGQRSGSITRRYIHHLDRALIEAADRVSENILAMMNGAIGGEVVALPARTA